MELFMKERLRREHYLLIYADIDKYKLITRATKTVSWTVLTERLKQILGEKFNKIDAGRLDLAQSLRNQMIHYDVELSHPQVYHDFANLLNFIVRFYEEFLAYEDEKSLKDLINENLWLEVDDLYFVFSHDIVYYNNNFMTKEDVEEIEQCQKLTKIESDGKIYSRIKYGDPEEWNDWDSDYADRICHDCGVVKGQYHTKGCDMERCPVCRDQFLSCGCPRKYLEP